MMTLRFDKADLEALQNDSGARRSAATGPAARGNTAARVSTANSTKESRAFERDILNRGCG